MDEEINEFQLLSTEPWELNWVLDNEQPLPSVTSREVTKWVEQVYNYPDILTNKRLLVNALDIIESRSSKANENGNSNIVSSPITPYRELMDIQVLARMQEDSLRESTLNRSRKGTMNRKRTPVQDDNSLSGVQSDDRNYKQIERSVYNSVKSAEPRFQHPHFVNAESDTEHGLEEFDTRCFRNRNLADVGTFRVKRKDADNIKRPVIDKCNTTVSNSNFEETTHNDVGFIQEEMPGTQRPMITKPCTVQRPVIKSRSSNLIPPKLSVPKTSSRTSQVNPGQGQRSEHGLDSSAEERDLRSSRNKSIPRNRSGIPLISNAHDKTKHSAIINNSGNVSHVSSIGGMHSNANSNIGRLSSRDSRSISPGQRRRNNSCNSSTAPGRSLALKKVTSTRSIANPNVSRGGYGYDSNNIRKSQLPTSLSSNSLKNVQSSVNPNDSMSITSSNFALDDEFY